METPPTNTVPPGQASTPSTHPGNPPATATGGPGVTEEQIWETLRTCYDPEIPINIVDLGLIYDVVVDGSRVDVKMTLTAPGCHMGGQIASEVQTKILSIEAVEEANVDLVWDPPWHQSMISAAGRKALGLD